MFPENFNIFLSKTDFVSHSFWIAFVLDGSENAFPETSKLFENNNKHGIVQKSSPGAPKIFKKIQIGWF